MTNRPGPPASRWLAERFGLRVPVVCAPMAGVAGGRLAAAVSAAGALGMVGVGPMAPADWVTEQCDLAAGPGRPFGVGLLAWSLPAHPEQIEATIAARPSLVSISFGPYEGYVAPLREAGIVCATQAGTVDEARAAVAAGVDVVVARGGEGGGHGRNDVGTLVLVQSVLDALDVPVLAAGGVARASGVAAVLAAGAAGAWVGTAFMACPEALTPAGARQRLLAAGETDTAYGRVFDIAQHMDWPPEYGGRALRNRFFDRWADRYDALAADPDAPAELQAARRSGDFDTASIYAGQGVGLLRGERSAAEVVSDLAAASELLRRAAPPP